MPNKGFSLSLGDILWLETFILLTFGLGFLESNLVTEISTSNLTIVFTFSCSSSCRLLIYKSIFVFIKLLLFSLALNKIILSLSLFLTEGDLCLTLTDIPVMWTAAGTCGNI
jgi:hypothetical protein